jgi:hypothetical protein
MITSPRVCRRCAHQLLDIGSTLFVDEEAKIPLGGEAHHDPKPIPMGGVEQWARRRGEHSDSVQSSRRHLREVALHNFEAGGNSLP